MDSERSSDVKILVVDDNENNRFAFQQTLQNLDAEMIVVSSGRDALKQILAHEFAVVLLDVKMPDMSGFEVASLMRKNRSKSHIPIIFITGYDKSDVQVFKGYDLGAVDYLIQPVNPQILVSKVKVFVDLHRKTLALEVTEAASRFKSEFLANVSHELRSPLNSLMLTTGVLLEDRDGNLTKSQKDNLRVVSNAASDLHFLVNDLLDHTQVEKGIITTRVDQFNLREISNTLASMYAIQFEARNIDFRIEEPSDVVLFSADQRRIEQILRNLVSNALKFTPEGGRVEVFLSVKPGNPRVLRVEVCDSGCGIAPGNLETIFEHFKQLEVSGRRHEGTGLGLAISRRLAQLLGGSLEVKSEFGCGSTFVFTAPEREVDQPQEQDRQSFVEEPIPEDLSKAIRGKSVLVVDDDIRSIFALRQVLVGRGLSVYQAMSGLEAIRTAKGKKNIDVILLDIMMPGMDGFTTARHLRESMSWKDTPIVAMSGHASASADEYKNGPFKSFLRKPVRVAELVRAIAQGIGGESI